MRKPAPHIAIWTRGPYPGVWGVWASRASCRAGAAPLTMTYFFDTIALAFDEMRARANNRPAFWPEAAP